MQSKFKLNGRCHRRHAGDVRVSGGGLVIGFLRNWWVDLPIY